MSETVLVRADPFEPTALEEETELRALARALQLAEGFKLIFVRCNQPEQRQRLMSALRSQLPELVVQEIHPSESINHLLDTLRTHLKEPPPDAVFVSGLEYSLPTAADAHASPFVANLNAARNSFPLAVPCPLVLWVPDYVLTAIARGAPDFFSIRSGIFYFASAPQEMEEIADALTAGEEWTAESLSLAEKKERIAAIQSLIAEYEALPQHQRDYRAEIRRHVRLGNLLTMVGLYSAAQQTYRRAQALAGHLADPRLEAVAISDLGNSYGLQEKWPEAEAAYEEGLRLFLETGDLAGTGSTLINLGRAYTAQGRWSEAEQILQRSLTIFRDLGVLVYQGTAQLNLGNLYSLQVRHAEAEASYREALKVFRQVGHRIDEGKALRNLAKIFRQQERWAEAEEALQQSLNLAREDQNRVIERIVLASLHNLYRLQARMTEAEECNQRMKAIEDELGVDSGEAIAPIDIVSSDYDISRLSDQYSK